MCNMNVLLSVLELRLRVTWLSKPDVEVVGHRSAGVRRHRTVVVLLRPLDQSL